MTSEEAKQIIINNQMTYRVFAKNYNISVEAAIEIFRRLDLRKCSKGNQCANSDGPVQSRGNFCNNRNIKDGLDAQCNYCKKQYRQNNEKYLKQLSYQYHQKNKEYRNRRAHQHYQKNKERHNQRTCQYYQKNKEYFDQLNRQYYYENKEYHNQKMRNYNNSYVKFDIYNDQISYAEKTRRDPNNSELLQVRCTYCNQWFNPIRGQVRSRIDAFEGRKNSLGAESRFYCSDECKRSCPIYHRKEYSRDDPNRNHIGTSREVQPELRQLVFERDEYTCVRCLTHKNNLPVGISLHCHHIEGVRHEPLESADIDMCITVCSECHKEIHQIPGCTYQDMQCGSNKEVNLYAKSTIES